MTERRSVVGLDITTSAVSVARIREGVARPTLGVIPEPVGTGDYSPVANAQLAKQFAADVWGGIEHQGRPAFVVLNRLNVEGWRHDPSGPRRAGIWWAIAAKLGEMSVPVAEGPPTVFLAKLVAAQGVNSPSAAMSLINTLAPTVWTSARSMSGKRFRYSALVSAAAGCMALGIQTSLPVTGRRLDVLTKYGTWPTAITIEKTEAAWNAKYGGGPDPKEQSEFDEERAEKKSGAERMEVTA